MFCPDCKSEYIEGVVTCHDCGVSLVDQLEEEIHPNPKLVSVFTDGNPGIIAIVKSILEDAEIPYFVQGEEGQNLFSLLGPLVVMVREEDRETVEGLLKDLEYSEDLSDNEIPE